MSSLSAIEILCVLIVVSEASCVICKWLELKDCLRTCSLVAGWLNKPGRPIQVRSFLGTDLYLNATCVCLQSRPDVPK